MEPANEADAQFLQTAQRIGVIGVRQVERIVELTQQTGKPASEVAELYQLMTAGQVARVLRSLGESAPPATRGAFSPAPSSSSGFNLGPVIGILIIARWDSLRGISSPAPPSRRSPGLGIPRPSPAGRRSRPATPRRELFWRRPMPHWRRESSTRRSRSTSASSGSTLTRPPLLRTRRRSGTRRSAAAPSWDTPTPLPRPAAKRIAACSKSGPG